MIIACPACNTRYVVPDSAIGVEGRTVRCAKCKHSWFQDGPEIAVPEEQAAAAPLPTPPPPPPPPPAPAATDTGEQVEEAPAEMASDAAPAKPSVNHWRASETEAPTPEPSPEPSREPAAEEPAAPPSFETPIEREPEPEPEPVFYSDDADVSQFDYEPPFRGRRNPLKLWTAAAAVFALLALGTVAGVSYWGLPDWVPVSRPTFGADEPSLKLEFPPDQQDRRTLPNGTEYFGASGTVTNVGRSTASVPPILIVMRDERERIVYNWEITPPQTTLAPGETVTVKEAVTDVPRSAKYAEIGWKPN